MSGGSSIKNLYKEGDLDYFRLFPGHLDRRIWEVNFFNGLLAKLTKHPYMIKRIPGPPCIEDMLLHNATTFLEAFLTNMNGFEELESMFGLIMIHDVS